MSEITSHFPAQPHRRILQCKIVHVIHEDKLDKIPSRIEVLYLKFFHAFIF